MIINSISMLKRISLTLCFLYTAFIVSFACTSAIIGADMNPYGRPLLWKNRDTSTTDNKIEYIKGQNGQHSYVALFNANDKDLKEAWMGMNDMGFAIMNTASYNIKDDNVPEKDMDKEGIVMTRALQSCITVEDFQNLLDSLPKPLGVEANFGVIDAYGEGAFFETNNDKYVVYYLKDAPENVLIRTNYSHSGRKEEGYGFIREANAIHELQPYIIEKNITPEVLTEYVSRSFWHDLFKKDFSKEDDKWVIDQDFIPRYKTTATIVIEGCKPLENGAHINPGFITDEYIMWTGLGYPPCADIFPVLCSPDGIENSLRGLGTNGHSSQGDIVKQRRDEVFPFHKGNGDKYIDMDRLRNEQGTGYLQTLVPKNLEVYKTVRKKRDRAL